MSLLQVVFLFVAALLGGALNSVAGGGSFISFPALVFVGVPEIRANATNTVALWPGLVASMGPYRDVLAKKRQSLALLAVLSLVGGIAGAIVLLHTPKATFSALIPFLLLGATLLFAFGPTLTRWVRSQMAGRSQGEPAGRSLAGTLGIGALQLGMAFYGGFFGGGLGILLLALLSLLGMENIHEMNAVKVFLNALINGIAVVTFVVAGAIVWPDALVMVCGSIAGGYGGAFFARKLEPAVVRRFVIVVGVTMTIYFFVRAFL